MHPACSSPPAASALQTLLQERSSPVFSPAAAGASAPRAWIVRRRPARHPAGLQFQPSAGAARRAAPSWAPAAASWLAESEGQLASLTEQRAQGALVEQQHCFSLETWPARATTLASAGRDAQRQLHRQPAGGARSPVAEIARPQEAVTREATMPPPGSHQRRRRARRDRQGRIRWRPSAMVRPTAARATALLEPGRTPASSVSVAPVDSCVVVALAVQLPPRRRGKPARPCWSWCRSNDRAGGGESLALQAGENSCTPASWPVDPASPARPHPALPLAARP